MAVQRPNVILVLTDDQGYGDFSCHGNPELQTPCLDKIHGESVRLTDFHVSPVCSPTRAALLTGCDPVRVGIRSTAGCRSILWDDRATMADIFRDNGYRTGQFGKWHLGSNYPYRPHDRGFDDAFYFCGWDLSTAASWWNSQCFNDTYLRNGVPEATEGYCTDTWFDEAMTWMKHCQENSEPFFAYVATNAPHWPWYVPDAYRQPYAAKFDKLLASFFGMIANLDENMGRLDAFLTESGLAENTILVFITDNGTAKGEQIYSANMRGKKGSFYEGGHRVPCFIRWPSVLEGGRDICDLTAHIDILPTLMDLCGLTTLEPLAVDGLSLKPLLLDHEPLPQRSVMVSLCFSEQPRKGEGAVMQGSWRLIHGQELYNIAVDPAQEQNVAADHPEIVASLTAAYDAYWDSVAPSFPRVARVQVGTAAEPRTALTCFDWHGPKIVIGQNAVREGQCGAGLWQLHVATAGRYQISLRRWPEHTEAGLTDSVPVFPLEDEAFGVVRAGKALPIQQGKIRIAGQEYTRHVEDDSQAIRFQVELEEGAASLEAWFLDQNGNVLSSAYYAYVERITAR